MPHLAAELVDSIISFLHPHSLEHGLGSANFLDKSTAKAVAKCALVCRAWVPSSRRVLFYRMQIRKVTAHGLAKLFKRPQRLTFPPFVRELEFTGAIAEDRWMSTVFPRIAKHLLPTIHTVVLMKQWSGGQPTPSFHPLALSAITHFELVGAWSLKLSDTIRVIAAFSSLQTLKVWLDTNWVDVTLPEDTPPPPEPLRALHLRGNAMEALFSWIQRKPGGSLPVEILDLYFSFDTSENRIRSGVQYIHSLGQALQSLALRFEFWGYVPTPLLVELLPTNTRLRALSIHAPPTLTLALLKKISFPSQLKTLTLLVMFKYTVPPETWQEIDRMVAPTAIQRLHIVHVALRDAGVDQTRVLEAFPLSVARGIVVMQSLREMQ
ncbi:hypothetical protein C8R46DRAFT_1064815 [Mycena filopes]|nr:hypothetical protein C8R46DRAFT_1064815 [Mycena filopes]